MKRLALLCVLGAALGACDGVLVVTLSDITSSTQQVWAQSTLDGKLASAIDVFPRPVDGWKNPESFGLRYPGGGSLKIFIAGWYQKGALLCSDSSVGATLDLRGSARNDLDATMVRMAEFCCDSTGTCK